MKQLHVTIGERRVHNDQVILFVRPERQEVRANQRIALAPDRGPQLRFALDAMHSLSETVVIAIQPSHGGVGRRSPRTPGWRRSPPSSSKSRRSAAGGRRGPRRTYWRPPGPWPPPAVRIPSQSYRSNSLNLLSHQFRRKDLRREPPEPRNSARKNPRFFQFSHRKAKEKYSSCPPQRVCGEQSPTQPPGAASTSPRPSRWKRRGNPLGCRPAREFSAGGFARRHISGKTAETPPEAEKRGCFEEGPRSAGAATPADRLGPTVCTRGAIAAQTGSKIAMP